MPRPLICIYFMRAIAFYLLLAFIKFSMIYALCYTANNKFLPIFISHHLVHSIILPDQFQPLPTARKALTSPCFPNSSNFYPSDRNVPRKLSFATNVTKLGTPLLETYIDLVPSWPLRPAHSGLPNETPDRTSERTSCTVLVATFPLRYFYCYWHSQPRVSASPVGLSTMRQLEARKK